MKSGTPDDRNFKFAWEDLDAGLWAVLSDVNLRGKSTALAVVRAAVQGQFPGNIADDVWLWISSVKVQFKIDEACYRIQLKKQPGQIVPEHIETELARLQEDVVVNLYSGPLGNDFEQQVASLFRSELGIQPFFAYNSKDDAVRAHDWPSIASALFLTQSDSKAIFGDVIADGLPLRLLQMFIGLPWVSTYTAAHANANQVEAKLQNTRTENRRDAEARTMRMQELQEQRRTCLEKLRQLPDRAGLRKALNKQDAELALIQRKSLEAAASLQDLQERATQATEALTERRRLLRQLEDDVSAGYVFRKLRPVCCPACESDIDVKRFSEEPVSICPLCGTEEHDNCESDDARVAALKLDIEEAKKTAEDLQHKASQARTVHEDATSMGEDIRRQLETIQLQLMRDDQAASLEHELIGLTARIEELERASETAGKSKEGLDAAILAAAAEESRELFIDTQREVLKSVSGQLMAYSSAFGVPHLQSMEIDLGGRLKMIKGGAETFFGKLSPGERLRVRIAAALAVVHVAQKIGYGRHPGLLIVNSPGAQEVVPIHIEKMVSALANTLTSIPGFQVFIGAIAKPEIEKSVPLNNRKQAKGDDYLF